MIAIMCSGKVVLFEPDDLPLYIACTTLLEAECIPLYPQSNEHLILCGSNTRIIDHVAITEHVS
jgi:hypothetical protein